MSRPRPILAGRTYLVSRRISQREFLLRPDGKINEALVFVLLRALEKYNVRLVAAVAMSNHWHLVVYDPDGVLPDFLRYLHGLLGRVVNSVRGRWENLWSVEQVNINHLVDVSDVIAKAIYVLINPVTDHLVDRSIHWPGFNTYAWLDGRTITAERPRFFFGKRSKLPEKVTTKLVAPPGFRGTFDEWAETLRAGVAKKEREAAAERAASGRRVLGRKGVLAQSPHHRPATPAPRGGLRPFVAAKNVFSRMAALDELESFRMRHAFAKAMFKLGWRTVPFPPGTWAMVQIAGVSVAPS